jgi:hypothetical protein
MNGSGSTVDYRVPTRRGILLSTALAAVIALIILVTIVLPVEYDLDPTGMGEILGLTAIAAANTDESAAAGSMSETPQDTPVAEQYALSTDAPFRTEMIEISMQGDEELEYKFQMRKGQVLVYTWSSGDAEVYYEFHAEPTEGKFPEGYYLSYAIGDGATHAHGSLVAPFTGNHGWYFLNLTEHPITVKLEVSGYYTSHRRLF